MCSMANEGSSNPSTVASRTDPGWKYCHPAQENRTNGCICKFCGKTTWGGITRMKEHLIGKKGNCKACPKCPKEVREELLQYVKDKKKHDSEALERMHHDLLDDYGDSDEKRALDEGFREIAEPNPIPDNASGRKNASKGPIDLYLRRPESAIEKKKKREIEASKHKGGM
ncbi:Zinc finger, BED-type [Sesbania bispinosa]|nr:Zinc finger, BED-type [Sesbania bispinosa]